MCVPIGGKEMRVFFKKKNIAKWLPKYYFEILVIVSAAICNSSQSVMGLV